MKTYFYRQSAIVSLCLLSLLSMTFVCYATYDERIYEGRYVSEPYSQEEYQKGLEYQKTSWENTSHVDPEYYRYKYYSDYPDYDPYYDRNYYYKDRDYYYYRQREERKNDRAYVKHLYREYLGREPSKEELHNQLDDLDYGATHKDMKKSIRNSREAHETYVRNLYRQYLHREPDEQGFNHYVNQLDSGVSPEKIKKTIKHSPESTSTRRK